MKQSKEPCVPAHCRGYIRVVKAKHEQQERGALLYEVVKQSETKRYCRPLSRLFSNLSDSDSATYNILPSCKREDVCN